MGRSFSDQSSVFSFQCPRFGALFRSARLLATGARPAKRDALPYVVIRSPPPILTDSFRFNLETGEELAENQEYTYRIPDAVGSLDPQLIYSFDDSDVARGLFNISNSFWNFVMCGF